MYISYFYLMYILLEISPRLYLRSDLYMCHHYINFHKKMMTWLKRNMTWHESNCDM